MDRLEEIRQKAEAGGPIRRIDMKYLLSEVDRLNALHKREIIIAGEYAQRVIDLTARAEAAEARADAAVEDMTAVLKRDSDDICAYCKNRIECKSQQCEKYSSGVGDVDGNYPDWKWTCMDFNYGTCSLLADTPCNGCFDDAYKGFEWRGPQEAGKERKSEPTGERLLPHSTLGD